ncbi:protamine-3 [Marmota marmota marmota]|uniref:protamine-3 n=1 Tax=Marmota marmota marmota TaxID=9994 RepID=UPI002093D66B|nr:protamine-3 [Marmota marmota marmota]
MGSRCAKLSTGHGTGQGTGHSRGHESSMKKLVACMSQDNFSLSSEGEEEEQEEEEEEEEEEEQLPGQGKLLLMEPERQEGSAEDNPGGPRRAPRPSRRTCNARGPGGVPAAGGANVQTLSSGYPNPPSPAGTGDPNCMRTPPTYVRTPPPDALTDPSSRRAEPHSRLAREAPGF